MNTPGDPAVVNTGQEEVGFCALLSFLFFLWTAISYK